MTSDDLESLAARVRAIEARQREARVHDPGCAYLLTQTAQFIPLVYAQPGKCCCWLSEEP